jgi:hypothetical protein
METPGGHQRVGRALAAPVDADLAGAVRPAPAQARPPSIFLENQSRRGIGKSQPKWKPRHRWKRSRHRTAAAAAAAAVGAAAAAAAGAACHRSWRTGLDSDAPPPPPLLMRRDQITRATLMHSSQHCRAII